MAEFPCPLERTAASALLLLSATPPSPSPSLISAPQSGSEDQSIKDRKKRKICRESLVLNDPDVVPLEDDSRSVSTSCTSSLLSEGSSEEIRARQMRIMAILASHHEMKLKVLRRSRSKIFYSSSELDINSGEAMMISSASESAEASCLSSSSTTASSAPSRKSCFVTRDEQRHAMLGEEMGRKRVGSAHMRRRADAILKLLSGGCSSEQKIRQLLGDSPDTSKALRMLLKLEEVKRSGTGGRQDPYTYMIAQQK